MSNCLALHGQDKIEKLEYKCQSFNRMGITHYCCLCILFMYLCLLHKYFCVSKWELKRSRCKTINVSKCHIILISIQLCGTWISDEHSVHVVIMTISPPFSWIDYSKYGYVLCQFIPKPGIKIMAMPVALYSKASHLRSVWTPFHPMYEISTLYTNGSVQQANIAGAFMVHQANAAGAFIVHQGNAVEHFRSYIK